MRPLVSVLVPTFRGAPWLRETLSSAIRQTERDLEIVVVDDGSDDATVELARGTGDPRVRVVAHAENVGLARNWNRGLRATRSRFVKPLLQDDLLEPDCVARLLAPALARDDVDLVYAPRRLLVEDPGEPEASAFVRTAASLHDRAGPPPPVEPAGALAARWIAGHCLGNLVGEPSCLLVRRAAFERIGGFHARMVQLVDMETWGRLAFHGAVAFVDAPLSTFRVHAASASRRHRARGLDWLDQAWLVEGLLEDPAIVAAFPALRRHRAHERRRVLRRLLRAVAGRGARPTSRPVPGLRALLLHRLRRLVGLGRPLHAPIPPVPAE